MEMAKKVKISKKRLSVRGSIFVPELAKAGSSLSLQIYADKRKIGELLIGQGSLYWYGRKKQKSKRIPWRKFAELMDEHV